MKIAIHHKKNDFSPKWIEYCINNRIDYKIVNCYDNNIINQLADCDALMWHFHHQHPKDVLFAKQLLYSLQMDGKVVFPDFNTVWHFDDKVGQKYLLESIGAPLVPSYVFYDKQKALQWTERVTFPKVFKLRRGSGSNHVQLVDNRNKAQKLIRKAFGRGFRQYNALSNLKERWRRYRIGKVNFSEIAKGIGRLVYPTEFSRVAGKERGYVYFQDFIPDNDYDIRVIVINEKAFAIKRLTREGDFRASGSGHVLFNKYHFDEQLIDYSFKIAEQLKNQCLAIDYVFQNGKPLIVEISYGFTKEPYYKCEGYWDQNLNWNEGAFEPQGWMVQDIIERVKTINARKSIDSVAMY